MRHLIGETALKRQFYQSTIDDNITDFVLIFIHSQINTVFSSNAQMWIRILLYNCQYQRSMRDNNLVAEETRALLSANFREQYNSQQQPDKLIISNQTQNPKNCKLSHLHTITSRNATKPWTHVFRLSNMMFIFKKIK